EVSDRARRHPAVRTENTENGLDGRGLATAALSDDTHDLGPPYVEADLVDSVHSATTIVVNGGQAIHRQHRLAPRPVHRSGREFAHHRRSPANCRPSAMRL